VIAEGAPVGDTWVYPGSAGFPTMTANSVPLTTVNNVPVTVGTPPAAPAAPTTLTAALGAGPQVTLTWMDNATTETGFLVERCSFVAPAPPCTIFAQIAAAPAHSKTGTTTYVDATVLPGNSYLYRVAAVNGSGTSAYATLAAAVVVPSIPTAPSGFTVAAVKASGKNYTATLTWKDNSSNETGFTIQRATNLQFTTGLTTFTAAANATTLTQTITSNTTYYYRIQANNIGGSSAWVNALPFPIRTGP
jgi:hypothetical protein